MESCAVGEQYLLMCFQSIPVLGQWVMNTSCLDNQADMADELFDGNDGSGMMPAVT